MGTTAKRLGATALVLAAIPAIALLVRGAAGSAATRDGAALPAPALDAGSAADREVAVFAGGCFWGVQAVFQHVAGVLSATSGYAGGDATTASYPIVSTGRTRHAESVLVVFDPERVSYGQLLHVFFSVAHDPTQLNRQGPDHGPQYRSAIWYTTPDQERTARSYIEQLQSAQMFEDPIVTELNAFDAFHIAEEYHQDYLRRHPRQPYIVIHDLPKLDHLERAFPELWQDEPVSWSRESVAAGR